MHPERAFQEIGRTLKPGGVHVFTAPTPSKTSPTFNALTEYYGTITAMTTLEIHATVFALEGSLSLA